MRREYGQEIHNGCVERELKFKDLSGEKGPVNEGMWAIHVDSVCTTVI